MNKLNQLFEKHNQHTRLIMAHCIAGYPSKQESYHIAKTLTESGADIIELQVPFSDPLADGPTIMAASQEAIRNGTKTDDVLEIVQKLTTETSVPIVIMAYANSIFNYGIERFVLAAKKAGTDGLIIPDLPIDSPEGALLFETTKKNDMCMILVISPGVSEARLFAMKPFANGFIYCTSRQGITGADSKFAPELDTFIKKAKAIFNVPIGLGFGIQTAEDVCAAAKIANIVIMGSVFVKAAQNGGVESVKKTAERILLL